MPRLRVLLVPDSIHWATGTIARSIARHNPWIEPTIVSGEVLDVVLARHPELAGNFQVVHFLCAYAGRAWLPRLKDRTACVATHHHVTDWPAVAHNLEADAVMTDSQEWVEDLARRGFPRERAVSVPSGVDVDLFRPAPAGERQAKRAELGLAPGAIAIGFFAKRSSNDDDRKGTDILCRAAVRVRASAPDAALVIVGPGWEEMVRRLEADGVRCVWLPYVEDTRELARVYAALDFYWVSSRVEGGPVTLVEAMASGVCCITTPVGIAREIAVDGVTGAVVPIGDVDALAARTLELARDPGRRACLGEAGRRIVVERMSAAVTMRRIHRLYSIALEAFAARTGRVVEQPAAESIAPPADAEAVPLAGLPARIAAEVRMRESVAWAEHLAVFHDERGTAMRMLLRAWARNPLSLLPPRALLRRMLPAPIVAKVVELKRRAAAAAAAGRG